MNGDGDKIGRKTKERDLQLKDYISGSIWCQMYPTADCSRPPRNIDEAHVVELRDAIQTMKLDYMFGMMTVTIAGDMHPNVQTWGDIVARSDGGFALRPDPRVRARPRHGDQSTLQSTYPIEFDIHQSWMAAISIKCSRIWLHCHLTMD